MYEKVVVTAPLTSHNTKKNKRYVEIDMRNVAGSRINIWA
jgi:hypothetical protein